MEQLNRDYRCSQISERTLRAVVRCFALDLTATKTTAFTALTRKSVTRIFLKIRARIAAACARASPFSACEVEVEESDFGARRVRGKRGRGASGKTLVFGICKRNGRVYTEIVPDCKKRTLQTIMRGRLARDAVSNSEGWRGYDGLVDVGYAKHFRVHHGQDEFVRGTAPVNGIESFWSSAKRRLQQFNGIPAATFNLHLKECEDRFNHRGKNLSRGLLKLLVSNPL